jgi:putative CocE/NonD family hydrolase
MQYTNHFPVAVREIEHLAIPLADGCRLAARIWLPEDAETHPVPAILEYIPYRKNDATLARDAVTHPYIAGHGYASVRVDLRGSGESEGLLRDEYLQQEIDDGIEVVAWLAAQTWCDGNVGMIGISWGGFSALQIAAMRPPALKAIVTCCSTDDRYADDAHYMGGCLLSENLSWASNIFSRNTLPPDPRHAGERWREMWMERLQECGFWLGTWLSHQHRDDYWRHGSVCENYSAIRCPVYAVGGWADGYCNAVFRLLEGLLVPRKGLVGPWAHAYPHFGEPGPAIGFLDECLRWWDQWLKGRDTGIMDEPMLRAYMQDPAPPRTWYAERSGRWIAEEAWPSPRIEALAFALTEDKRLSREADAQAPPFTVSSPLTVGLYAGKWCSYGAPGDQPGNQAVDDAASLVFESDPLDEPIEVLGEAALNIDVASDKAVAMIAARLNDVAPDGAVTRTTYGILNLTQRDGHSHPHALVPGTRSRVRVPFKHIGQRFDKGHRIRLALSTSYFPIAWPAPEPVTLTVFPAESRLVLPQRRPRAEDEMLRAFAEPRGARPIHTTQLRQPEHHWRVVHDLAEDGHALEIGEGQGMVRIEAIDLTITSDGTERYSFRDNDYASVCGETHWVKEMSRGDWRVRTVTSTRLTSDSANFHIEAKLEAHENERRVHERSWRRTIPRRLV